MYKYVKNERSRQQEHTSPMTYAQQLCYNAVHHT